MLEALSSDALSQRRLLPFVARVETEMRYDMALSRFIVDVVSNRVLNPLWLSALTVIAKRAAADSDYCDRAAGVFAGIVPARELLALPYFWRTAKSTARVLGIAALEMLRRRLASGRRSKREASIMTSMFKELVRHPATAVKWCRDCAWSGLELAKQMAASAK